MIGNLGLLAPFGQHGHRRSRAILLPTHELREINPETDLVRHRCAAIVAQSEPPDLLIGGFEEWPLLSVYRPLVNDFLDAPV